MTDAQFYRHALEVLPRELGVDGFARFLRLSRSGGGDYTRDREFLPCGCQDRGRPRIH